MAPSRMLADDPSRLQRAETRRPHQAAARREFPSPARPPATPRAPRVAPPSPAPERARPGGARRCAECPLTSSRPERGVHPGEVLVRKRDQLESPGVAPQGVAVLGKPGEVLGAFERHPPGDRRTSARAPAPGGHTRSRSPRARAATSGRRRPGCRPESFSHRAAAAPPPGWHRPPDRSPRPGSRPRAEPGRRCTRC